jgi:hypothetical protein
MPTPVLTVSITDGLAARFWAKVKKSENCWIWQGNISNGHGRFRLRKEERELTKYAAETSAHFVAWWLEHGCHETFIDRSCGNTLCVNPQHLVVRTSEDRFWAKVEKTEGCWLWKGARSANGYGTVWHKGKCYAAHRLSWVFAHGAEPTTEVIRHSCDNPSCVRPDHLVPGTQADNVHDMIDRGRQVVVKGERVALAKLTNAQVRVLKRAKRLGLALQELSVLVGLSEINVRHALSGHSYCEAGDTTIVASTLTPRVICKVTYPNGKIYVGQDITNDICYFGSANSDVVARDFTQEQRQVFTVIREVLWVSTTATLEEVRSKELELIVKLQANNPEKGYNRRPKFRPTKSSLEQSVTKS